MTPRSAARALAMLVVAVAVVTLGLVAAAFAADPAAAPDAGTTTTAPRVLP